MTQSFHTAHYSEIPSSGFDGPVEDWTDRYAEWRNASEYLGTATLNMTVVEKAPGDEGVMHAHEPPVEEVYVVLEGELDIKSPDRTVEGARPGTIAYFPPGVEHTTVNNSDAPTVSIAFRSLAGDVESLEANVSIRPESASE